MMLHLLRVLLHRTPMSFADRWLLTQKPLSIDTQLRLFPREEKKDV